MEKQRIVGRCSVCGEPLTMKTVWIGDHELLCPVHAPTRRRLLVMRRDNICMECKEEIPPGEECMDDDGLLCQYCGRHRRVVREAA